MCAKERMTYIHKAKWQERKNQSRVYFVPYLKPYMELGHSKIYSQSLYMYAHVCMYTYGMFVCACVQQAQFKHLEGETRRKYWAVLQAKAEVEGGLG